MFFGNRKSMKVHYDVCKTGKLMNRSNTEYFYTYAEARAKGYRLCQHCNPITKKAHLRSSFVQNYLLENGMSCYMKEDVLYIETNMSKWYMVTNSNGTFTLYHKNECGDKNKYHTQRCNIKDIFETLLYINQHDEYRRHNPVLNRPIKVAGNPKKGSKRYKKKIKREKALKKKSDIRNVLFLIEGLSVG